MMQRPPEFKGKSGRNHNLLLVTGERIRLVTFASGRDERVRVPVEKAPTRRTADVGTARPPVPAAAPERADFYQLPVSNYVNGDACSVQLRDIREAVQVSDFQRLLRKFRGPAKTLAKDLHHRPITCIDADSVYASSYGYLYEEIKHITAKH